MITLRQLRYFNALAGALHFGRAAEACSVTQPALSMQIKELESALGLALIERGRSGVRLTPDGREVARRAAQVLLDIQELQDFAANRQGELGHALSLGVIPTIAPYFLPQALPQLQQQHPQLELQLHEAQTARLLDALAGGELDVALLALPVAGSGFETMPLFEDRFLLALPGTARAPETVRVEELKPDSLILLEEGHCLRDQALAVCGSVARGTMNRFGATSLRTILQMVGNGYGATLLPEMAVPVEVPPEAPLLLRNLAPEPSRTVGLVWRASAGRREQFRRLGMIFRQIWRDTRSGTDAVPMAEMSALTG